MAYSICNNYYFIFYHKAHEVFHKAHKAIQIKVYACTDVGGRTQSECTKLCVCNVVIFSKNVRLSFVSLAKNFVYFVVKPQKNGLRTNLLYILANGIT